MPVGAAQQLAAATELREHDFALARLSARWVRALARPFWLAGWTNIDLLRALREVPTTGGTTRADRCPAVQLRRPDGWVRHRLGRWRRPMTGAPLPPPTAWERTLGQLAEVHGAAGSARMSYGEALLRVEDLTATPWERAEALEVLRRRRAAELADARAAIRPAAEIAKHPREHSTRIRAQLGHRQAQSQVAPGRQDRLSKMVDAEAPGTEAVAPTPPASSMGGQTAREHEQTWRRALARARESRRRWRDRLH